MTAGPDARWSLMGAGGLVGTHLAEVLHGRDVVATAHRTRVADAILLDLTDAHAVRDHLREVRPDVVVIAAADAFVERCEREPGLTRALNVDAVRTIAELAPRALLVAFSSEYVFDGRAGPYAED